MSADDGFNLLNAPQESGETAGDKEIHDKMNLEAVNNPPLLLNAHLQDLCKDEEVQEMKLQKAVEKLELDSDTNSLEAKIIKPPIKWQDVPVLNISGPGKPITVTEWAEVIDESEPVPDFQEKIQNMALTFPFELDNFQKQAILKLEEGYHVLVAAHTSAGKTVVAEYAIAMSRKNNTRTIYTSPIKALSNQKYNDFKKMFGEVGLLTGDLQINVTAPVLVMTTEILRSKLYFSDEVTRDLEFVIIDEVHYINHAERGYVWEEVLILLPAHVSIVMLSSTVPNTLQFADWLGRTKNRKVYVVSTPKRPVPLCHFLYTGMGEKTMNKSFLVVDQEDKFHLDGYNKAVASKTKREVDNAMCLFPPDCYSNNEAEQRMWISLIKHLKQQDKLPVISFTLARNRCDQIAKNLLSLNLTNRKEKVKIRNFFRKCLLRLTRADRLLPQVTNLRKLLIYGIGVHHSGILPLLKEIVEMLFQSGFVKILFATETFAMGVNMPARTVVFNDIIKFDGQRRRLLSPTEYIQMAGRAGRRGIDETGTVIIVCKKFVPDLVTLKDLVLGVPQELSSQFRLTYAMILGLLRASTVTVEAMMRRSFRESHQIRQVDNYKVQLQQAEKNHEEKFSTPLACHLAPLALYYDAAAAYINTSDRMLPFIFNDEKVEEEMVPGKVLVISSGPYMNKIAVLLYNFGRRKEKKYKVLVLKTNDRENAITNLEDQTWCRMLSFSALFDYIGTEKKTLEHNIISVAPKNIVAITKIKLEFDATVIIGDWERRQLERFKDVPIGVSCLRVVKTLSRISYDVYWGLSRLEYINFTQLVTNTDENYLIWLDEVETCKADIKEYRDLTDTPTFEEDFAIVYERKVTESKLKKYTKLLAFENLTLYPEYQRRLNVLRELHYIDEDDNIILKGQAACCMGANELIITELIWRQVFTDKTPAEIAALLSCFVLQTRIRDRNKLWESLLEGQRDIEDIDAELTAIESRHLVGQFRSHPERLNFGLMKLVHEWVQEQSFLEVMDYVRNLQEGIVVRCIQQLHELLIDVKDAAVVLGDTNLEAKMVVATTAIRRGIVFASSLYTIQDETLNPLE